MLILGLDFETTGLSVTEDRIIEIGAVLWDTDRKTPLLIFSQLVNPAMPVSQVITEITGITQSDVDTYGKRPYIVLEELSWIAKKSEAIVAHNGTTFDRPLLESELRRCEFGSFPSLPWVDTSVDIPYPEAMKTRKLVHLAAEHNFINPFAHRALSDVLTMLKVLAHYDINEVLRISQEPSVRLIADVKKPWLDAALDGSKEVDKAKARGYRFDGATKQWVKITKQSNLAAEQSHGEFYTRILET